MKAASVYDFADEGTRILMVIWPLFVIWLLNAVPRLMGLPIFDPVII